MTELVVPLTAALDAVDIVDASDIVDVVATPAKKIFEEFQYQAMTLQGETVEEARTAAEQEFSSAVVDDSNAATAVENIAATTKMSTENDTEIATIANTSTSTTTTNDNNNDKSSRFVTPKDFELLKVIGMGGALTMVLLALHRIDNNSTLFFLSYLYQHAFSATGSSSLWFVCNSCHARIFINSRR